MPHDTFVTLAVILGLAALAGLAASRLRQPVIIAFIGIGVLVGPVGFGWVVAEGPVELMAELGIALLLFVVGLRLDFHLVRATGPVALATGLGQVVFSSALGFGVARLLSMGVTESLYVALALAFSSTIIVIKLLTDRREIDQLHGRIAVGVLIVQDIVVVLAMIVLTAIGGVRGGSVLTEVGLVGAKGAALLAGMALLMRFVLPRLVHEFARVNELLVIFGVTWAVVVAAVTELLGFSTEVGAFLAGFSLASTPFREAIAARLVSLRDFLLLFFFIALGSQIEVGEARQQLAAAAILSAVVLVGKPIVVLAIMGLMRYPARLSFVVGVSLAQISEFSLILAALGLSLGHIGADTVSLITVVGLITIAVSTYVFPHARGLYRRLERVLSVFDRRRPRDVSEKDDERDIDVILYGLGRLGSGIARGLLAAGKRAIAVDVDPRLADFWSDQPITTLYGDAEDLDFLETLPLARSTWVICTIPSVETQLTLLHGLRSHGYPGKVAVVALDDAAAKRLSAAGPEFILRPFVDAAASALDLVLGYGKGAVAVEESEALPSE
ncbi:MAG: cation:proton antiporter [Acidimicrobiia bacterium]